MNLGCFSCSVYLGKGKNVINIFDDESLQSKRKICDVIGEIVDRQITESTAHSKILCKKCYGTVKEYDSLNIRLKLIKSDFTKELQKVLPHYQLLYESRCTVPKAVSKNIVLSSSKLQPLPTNYILDMVKLPVSKPTIPLSSVAYKGVLPELFKTPTTTLGSSQNLNVTIVSTVLTQNLNASVTATNTTTLSKITDTNISDTINTISQSKTKNPVMSYNLSTVPKDFLVTNSEMVKLEEENDTENNDDQAMEIDEDCTLAVGVTSDDQDKSETDFESSPNKKASFDLSMLLSQGITQDDKDGKYIIDRFKIIDGNEDDEDGQVNLLDDDGRTTIIRVAAGQQVLYDGKQIALLQDEIHDNTDSLDSNDESQIELQVSGDEETANAIIAAAQERGGAFIKVESGEMYRVQSIESKPDEQDGDAEPAPLIQNIVEKDGDQYKCLLCEDKASGVGSAEAVVAHVRSVHGARAYICPICGIVVRKRADYTKHIAEHASKTKLFKSKLHECSYCQKKYNSRTLLKEHLNIHIGARPYTCATCGKTFASKYTHQAHLKTHSLRPRPFKCEQCGKTFFTQQNLSQHEKTHSGIKDFVCNICGKAYATQHNLEVHGVVHTGRKPFPCLVCSKPFARRAEVRDHMRIHTGERPFACDVCGATFTQRSNLHSHTRATHLGDKRHACQHCPKRFKRKRLLEYHIKAAHTGERPLQCAVCLATFVYPEHYKKHGRIHSGERPYTCEVCGKSFNSRDNRNMHRFVHSDKKPYECLTCGAGYMRKRLLYTHMNTTGHVAESIVVNQPRVIRTTGLGTAPVIDVNAIEIKADKFPEDAAIFEAEEVSEENQIGTVVTTVSENDAAKLFLIQDKKDATVNLVQEGDEPTFVTLHNFNGLIEATDDKQIEEQIQVVTDENGESVRLIQVQLPGGQVGWIALDH